MSIIMKILDAIWITPILGDQVDAKNLPKKIFYVPFAVEIREQERKKESSKVKILTIGKFVKRRREETHVAASCNVSDEQLDHHLFEKKNTELKLSPAAPDVDRNNDVISMSFKKRTVLISITIRWRCSD